MSTQQSQHLLANFAVIIPLADEAQDFDPFIQRLLPVLEDFPHSKVYFVVDNVSKDNTLMLCQALSQKDPRFITIFAPENKNVVHAYQRGFKAAYDDGFDFMIEMDGGLSHNPLDLPSFVEALYHGQECVFGSRNIPGGSNTESPLSRRFLSKSGTMLANIFLGTKLKDMTSGFIGFRRHIVEKFIQYPWQSIAHFYHSEIRYLLRHTQHIEIPIRYRAPSPRVQLRFITNAFRVLGFYTLHRVLRKDIYL